MMVSFQLGQFDPWPAGRGRGLGVSSAGLPSKASSDTELPYKHGRTNAVATFGFLQMAKPRGRFIGVSAPVLEK